ncbi:hypothetical protein OQZ59_06395 [Lacticaseibacillus nasuensis]|nr:hypothetical protein [Lacticaseibacillus nasuensis]
MTTPVWMQKWLWPLENEYGSVINVPDDDPRLRLLRMTVDNPSYLNPQLESAAKSANQEGWQSAENRSVEIDKYTPDQIDQLIWKLHLEGRANSYIAVVTGFELTTLRKRLLRLRQAHGDYTDYIERRLSRMVDNGDSKAKMMREVGYKYIWAVNRALHKYGLEE